MTSRLQERLDELMQRRRFVCPSINPATFQERLYERGLQEHATKYGWAEGIVIGMETHGDREPLFAIASTIPLPEGTEIIARVPVRGRYVKLARANSNGMLEPCEQERPVLASEMFHWTSNEGDERFLLSGSFVFIQFPPSPSSTT